jgi:hypothetical protein
MNKGGDFLEKRFELHKTLMNRIVPLPMLFSAGSPALRS